MINTEALEDLKLWHEKRGYDHEYLFTTQHGGQPKQMSKSWADDFCSDILTDILSRVSILTSLKPHVSHYLFARSKENQN